MVCKQHENEFKTVLRSKDLKATPARLAMLEVFAHSQKPLCIKELEQQTSGTDVVTLYRNVGDLAKKGVLNRIRLQDKKDYYEFGSNAHHHHLVCSSCGKVVDIQSCDVKPISQKLLERNGFGSFESHSLEFFGVCKKCSNN